MQDANKCREMVYSQSIILVILIQIMMMMSSVKVINPILFSLKHIILHLLVLFYSLFFSLPLSSVLFCGLNQWSIWVLSLVMQRDEKRGEEREMYSYILECI